jgi:hypothetical protein
MAYYSCSQPLSYTGGCLYVAVCGAEGIRTPDLISAIDALSQLSYSPIGSDKYSAIEAACQIAMFEHHEEPSLTKIRNARIMATGIYQLIAGSANVT